MKAEQWGGGAQISCQGPAGHCKKKNKKTAFTLSRKREETPGEICVVARSNLKELVEQ